jgi:hypothetical protein
MIHGDREVTLARSEAIRAPFALPGRPLPPVMVGRAQQREALRSRLALSTVASEASPFSSPFAYSAARPEFDRPRASEARLLRMSRPRDSRKEGGGGGE